MSKLCPSIENHDIDLIQKEYAQLWSYYHLIATERDRVFDFYFKILALITAAISFALSKIFSNSKRVNLIENANEIFLIVVALFMLMLIGLGCLFYIAKENRNSLRYILSMKNFRSVMASRSEATKVITSIDEICLSKKDFELGILFARCFPIVVLNAFSFATLIWIGLSFFPSFFDWVKVIIVLTGVMGGIWVQWLAFQHQAGPRKEWKGAAGPQLSNSSEQVQS